MRKQWRYAWSDLVQHQVRIPRRTEGVGGDGGGFGDISKVMTLGPSGEGL